MDGRSFESPATFTMNHLQTFWQRLQADDKLVGISEIARRYFAMNAFDGILTIIGVLMGNLTAGVSEARIVLATGLSTSVAMGVSGLWGAYLTETAERQRDLAEMSLHTLTDLRPTRLGRASRTAVVVVAVVDGISPALAAIIVLLPFIFISLLPSIVWAYYVALAFAIIALFALGIFLGIISKANWFFYGLKTVVAGLISILISYLIA